MPEQSSIGDCNFIDDGGLFKATMLWQNIVNHLELTIKCGRHTQALRSFPNSFHGSKVVECLLVHLNSFMTKTVKKPQVQTLCQKLVLMGVIEDVRDKDKGVFREGRLYRLTRNHFWSYSNEAGGITPIQRKLKRTRSAEEICTEKESDIDTDEKGYASDSTVSHSVHQDGFKPLLQDEKSCGKSSETVKLSKSFGTRYSSNPGMLRVKSTSAIYKSTEKTSTLDSSEHLLSVKEQKRKVSSSHKPSRTSLNTITIKVEAPHTPRARRGSIDETPARHSRHTGDTRRKSMDMRSSKTNGIGARRGSIDTGLLKLPKDVVVRGNVDVGSTKSHKDTIIGARRGSVDSSSRLRPPLYTRKTKARDDATRSKHSGKDKSLHGLSRSLKGESKRAEDAKRESKKLNRSHSLSSVGELVPADTETNATRGEGEKNTDMSSVSPTKNKWIVYGFL